MKTIRSILLVLLLITPLSIYAQEAGDLDPSFGSGGIVTFPDRSEFFTSGSNDNLIAVRRDGKVLLVGETTPAGATYDDLAIVRLLPNGSRDTSFGISGNGIITYGGRDSIEYGTTITLQQNEEILVNVNGEGHNLVRYLSEGNLDMSFGSSGGFFEEDFGMDFGGFRDIPLIQDDGKIIVYGSRDVSFSDRDQIILARIGLDGNLDSTFGDGGILVARGYDYSGSGILLRDSRILIVSKRGSTGEKIFVLFDRNGVRPEVHPYVAPNPIRKMIALSDGKIMAMSRYRIYRFNEDLSLDTTFGKGGFVQVLDEPTPYRWEDILDMAVQDDGKILLMWDRSGIHVMRLSSNGRSRDEEFGEDGVVNINLGKRNEGVQDITIQEDGKILLFGRADSTVKIVRLFGERVPPADISVEFINTEFRGGNLIGAVMVTNNGPGIAENVRLVITTSPPLTRYRSVLPESIPCFRTVGRIMCSIGDMMSEQRHRISFASFLRTLKSNYSLSARVSLSNTDGDSSNNQDSAVIETK